MNKKIIYYVLAPMLSVLFVVSIVFNIVLVFQLKEKKKEDMTKEEFFDFYKVFKTSETTFISHCPL